MKKLNNAEMQSISGGHAYYDYDPLNCGAKGAVCCDLCVCNGGACEPLNPGVAIE